MSKVYVRVKPKMGLQQFHRCAIMFTLAWALFEVDDATKERLENEQMLETSLEKPEGYVETASVDNPNQDATGTAGNTAASGPTELSDAEKLAAIKEAMTALDKTVDGNWTKSGLPNATVLTAAVGFDVSAAQRDEVWAELEAVRLAAEAAAAGQAGAQ